MEDLNWVIGENIDPDLVRRWSQLDNPLKTSTLSKLLCHYLKKEYKLIREIDGAVKDGTDLYCPVKGMFDGGNISKFLLNVVNHSLTASDGRGLIGRILGRPPVFYHGDPLAVCHREKIWIPMDKPEVAGICEKIQHETGINFRT